MKPTCARKAGSPDPRRDKAVDNGGLHYGAVESALRPPLPTATRALAETQIQASLDQRLRAKHHHLDPRGRRRVADIKSESRPASNRNAWPASSETALCPSRAKNGASHKIPAPVRHRRLRKSLSQRSTKILSDLLICQSSARLNGFPRAKFLPTVDTH
jgi:hypothetical protein